MTSKPHVIRASTITEAWLEALDKSVARGAPIFAPLVIVVEPTDFAADFVDNSIHATLNYALVKHSKWKLETTANTIFPHNLWSRCGSPTDLYDRYLRMLPRLKRLQPSNRHGTYFSRMIAFPTKNGTKNQLAHLVTAWSSNVRRSSAFQANIFDPATDHTLQLRRGFPCLQHVSFTSLGNGKFATIAVYPSEYLFDRAYGNYLGILRLSQFLGQQLDLQLVRITFLVGKAIPKGDNVRVGAIRDLVTTLRGSNSKSGLVTVHQP